VAGIEYQNERSRRWYAVRSQPRKEAVAALHLRRQGFRTFLSLIDKFVRLPSRTATTTAAFFPSHLFVSLSPQRDRWRNVNGKIGVHTLVGFGDQPGPTPMGHVERLVANASDEGRVCFDEPSAPGARVPIVGGPFDGLLGRFLKATDTKRVSILMSMLARGVTVKVHKAAVTAA
jgi:transcriptional antiterminator RfaH